MTGKEFVEAVIERVAEWPDDAKAELVDSIAQIEEKLVGVYQLSEEERACVRRGLEEMRQGKFASDEEVEALFKRYRG